MISVTILTKNSQRYLPEVLASVAGFDEVLIFDNGSTDHTLEIAASFPNVVIKKGEFAGFGPTHNLASALAKNDWILSLDSDEIVTRELWKEINALTLDERSVYSFPRRNFYNGKFIKWCGWHPDRQVRIYNKKKTRFTEAQVHESIISEGMNLVELKHPIHHFSYASQSEFLAKMQSYSELFANQNCGRKKGSPCKAVLHGFGAFLKAYIIKRGFLGGYEGFMISAYNGNTAFYKYLKLYEANKKLDKEDG